MSAAQSHKRYTNSRSLNKTDSRGAACHHSRANGQLAAEKQPHQVSTILLTTGVMPTIE